MTETELRDAEVRTRLPFYLALEEAARTLMEPEPDIGEIGERIDFPEVLAYQKRQRQAWAKLRAALGALRRAEPLP